MPFIPVPFNSPDVIELGGAAGLAAEDVVNVLEGPLEHGGGASEVLIEGAVNKCKERL